MAGKYIRIAKKLQTAAKVKFGIKLLIDQRQWYHKDKDTAVTCYTLYEVTTGKRGGSAKEKLFQTYSQIQLVLFMRDLWYHWNGWEIPTDNEVWEGIKRKYEERGEPTEDTPATPDNTDKRRWTAGSSRATVCEELYSVWKRNGSSEKD